MPTPSIKGHLKNLPGLIGMFEWELSAPISILLEVTRRCNLRCLHCFSNSSEKILLPELSTLEWKEFIDQLAKLRVFLIFFGGGEPLCREDFLEIAKHARERGIHICVLSNLTLIDSSIARALKDIGVYKVEGNLDGHDEKTYENLRQVPGSFQKTLAGISHCLEAGLPVRINCTLTRLNWPHLEDIAGLAYSLGVNDLAFIRLIPAGRGDVNFQELDLGEEIYRQDALPRLRHLRLRYQGTVNIGYEQDEEIIIASDPHQMLPWCGSGRIHCTVTPSGLVKPDHSFPDDDPEVIAGHIRSEDFAYIWRQSPVFRKIRHTRFPECEGCSHRGCAGGDVYRIYHHYGHLMEGRDPRCPYITGEG